MTGARPAGYCQCYPAAGAVNDASRPMRRELCTLHTEGADPRTPATPGTVSGHSGPCPHCPDGHEAPERRPWAVWVSEQRDHDGQPGMLIVAKAGGQHVAESDAEWLRQVIRRSTLCPGPHLIDASNLPDEVEW